MFYTYIIESKKAAIGTLEVRIIYGNVLINIIKVYQPGQNKEDHGN